jgi:NAD(P)H-dependent FMN reductase
VNTDLVVAGVGGSLRARSRSFLALSHALKLASEMGAGAVALDLRTLALPMFDPDQQPDDRPPEVGAYLDTIRECKVLILASPVYAGTVSGLVKNALDFCHDLRVPPGLSGRIVGLIAVGSGGGAATGTLAAMRDACRALGAWVEPRTVSALEPAFGEDGTIFSPLVRDQITVMMQHIMAAAKRQASPAAVPVGNGSKIGGELL